MKTQNAGRFRRFLQSLPPWTLSVVCALAICWLTLSPKPFGDNDVPLFPGADKIAHAIMFGGFASMLMLDRQRRDGWKPLMTKAVVIATVCAALFGIAIEFCQRIPALGRSFETADMYSDVAGTVIAAFIYLKLQQKWCLKCTNKNEIN